jgi:single-strand DNA-binding protein
MASFNKVILMGNLTRDPELRYTPNGQAVCEFTIAMNHKYVVGGQSREEVCFMDIVVWAKPAESCGRYLHKGASVFVEGRLKQDTWEDKEGRKRSKIRVNADRVQFISTRNTSAGSNAPEQSVNREYSSQVNNRPNQPASSSEPMPEPPEDIYNNDFGMDDDIPF